MPRMQRIRRIAPGALIPPLQEQEAIPLGWARTVIAAGSNPPDSLYRLHPYVL